LGLKRLEMFKDAVPGLSRVAVLSMPGWDSPTMSKGRQWEDLRAAALQVGIDIFVVEAREAGSDTDTTGTVLEAIAEAKLRGANGLLLLIDSVFESRRSLVAQAAHQYALPAMFYRLEFAEVGGLLAYAPDTLSEYRRVAQLVVQIVNGANPAELPIDRQTHYETALNLDTAQELGLEIPSSFLFKVTRFIGGAGGVPARDR
jgi:putative ABC transport system substrate-binding protein